MNYKINLTLSLLLRKIPLSMLKIRLQRIGRRNQPYYRMVVTDSRFGPKSGRFIEVLGSYDPKAGNVEIKKDRAEYWLNQGAQASDTAYNFLVDQGVIEGKKRNALPKKTPIVKEGEESSDEAETPAEETPSEDTSEEVVEAEESNDDVSEEQKEESPAEEPQEKAEEVPAEEKTEE